MRIGIGLLNIDEKADYTAEIDKVYLQDQYDINDKAGTHDISLVVVKVQSVYLHGIPEPREEPYRYNSICIANDKDFSSLRLKYEFAGWGNTRVDGSGKQDDQAAILQKAEMDFKTTHECPEWGVGLTYKPPNFFCWAGKSTLARGLKVRVSSSTPMLGTPS